MTRAGGKWAATSEAEEAGWTDLLGLSQSCHRVSVLAKYYVVKFSMYM